jgi:hypothetical protein
MTCRAPSPRSYLLAVYLDTDERWQSLQSDSQFDALRQCCRQHASAGNVLLDVPATLSEKMEPSLCGFTTARGLEKR